MEQDEGVLIEDEEIFEPVEGEEISDEDVVYQINTFGADFTVDGLVLRVDRGDIFRPEFQRNFVWSPHQASKFIESILLGFPTPSVILCREESTQKHLIVDGLQRLITLRAFCKGQFPNRGGAFRLSGVRPEFENKAFKDLEEVDRRRLEDFVIHAAIIQQIAPQDDDSALFHIFDRLNTGGTPPQPQEVRAAIYHGPFQELLADLNDDPAWRKIFGPKHKRAKDQELILRFLALAERRKKYAKPMKSFLNDFMDSNRYVDTCRSAELGKAFADTIRRALEALGPRAFRSGKSINVALFDAMMIAIYECEMATSSGISDSYAKLIGHDGFMTLSSTDTSDEANLHGRIDMAIEVVGAAA